MLLSSGRSACGPGSRKHSGADMQEGIDLVSARNLADRGDGLDEVRVTRRWLAQAVSEIERGRWAMAQARQIGRTDGELLDLSGTVA